MAEEYEYTREVETVAPLRNEANVQALEKLFQEMPWAMTYRGWAEFLASRGVLVPSALTDEQGEAVVMGGSLEGVIAQLERIARGEQP